MSQINFEYPELFNNCYNYRCFYQKKLSQEAVVIFHGFPSEKLFKNRDIAMKVASELKLDSRVMHYFGLGESVGEFSFLRSIKDSINWTEHLLTKYKKLHLVGHSWGGLVAINVLKAHFSKIEKVILLSPFNDLHVDIEPILLVREIMKARPYLFYSRSEKQILEELITISKKFNPRDIAKSLPAKKSIHIIQAKVDEDVPLKTTQEYLSFFKSKPKLEIWDIDHSFTKDREKLLKRVINLLAAG